ncbi:MAG: hypothetical protein WCB85_01195, partial [Candidatus Dormiibacterota bacterium]
PEYPHYTRPAVYEGMAVPEVLRSGDHAKIASWRAEAALERARRLRPDLLGVRGEGGTADAAERDEKRDAASTGVPLGGAQ